MYSRVAAKAALGGARQQSTSTALPNWFGVRINGKKVLVHPKATVLQACEEVRRAAALHARARAAPTRSLEQ